MSRFRVRELTISNSGSPPNQTDPGERGDLLWDDEYLYVCTGTNSWGRTSLDWSGAGDGEGGGGSSIDNRHLSISLDGADSPLLTGMRSNMVRAADDMTIYNWYMLSHEDGNRTTELQAVGTVTVYVQTSSYSDPYNKTNLFAMTMANGTGKSFGAGDYSVSEGDFISSWISGTDTGVKLIDITLGTQLTVSGPKNIPMLIDGGNGAIQTGARSNMIRVAQDLTINEWHMLSHEDGNRTAEKQAVGTVSIYIQKSSYNDPYNVTNLFEMTMTNGTGKSFAPVSQSVSSGDFLFSWVSGVDTGVNLIDITLRAT